MWCSFCGTAGTVTVGTQTAGGLTVGGTSAFNAGAGVITLGTATNKIVVGTYATTNSILPRATVTSGGGGPSAEDFVKI